MNLRTCSKWFSKMMVAAVAFVLGSAVAFAQTKTVSGTVIDNLGEPVIGANIVIVGTTTGTMTDIDGNFTLPNVPENATLKVSYIGYTTQDVSVAGKSKISVQLSEEGTDLDEVVVIGYGSVRKKDITGSVATISADAIQTVPVANASEALTGKMPGVQITTTEGSPDAEVKIRVRGGGSITQSNDPLFIVDGFPVDDISNIPSNEIEDITVLKDASSTAIYGSRGANGVILVTTKSGKSGKTSVSYNAFFSWSKIAKKFDVLGAKDYAKWQYELALLRNANNPAKISSYTDYFGNYQDLDLYDNVPENDWQDQVYGRTGQQFNHNLNISGGSDNFKYSFSYAHLNNKAIQIGSDFKRDNFALKMNTKPSKTTTLDFQVRYSMTKIWGSGTQDAAGSYDTDRRLKYAVIYTPFPLKNLDASSGSADDDLGNLYNPIESTWDNDRVKERKNLNMAGSFGWEIFSDFKVKTEFGYDDYTQYDQRFWGLTTYYVKNVPAKENQNMPAIRMVNTSRHRFRNTNTISYNFKKIFPNEDNGLDVMVGHEYVITKKHDLTTESHGFPTDYDAAKAWKLTNQGEKFTIDDFYAADDKLLSFFGRLNYNYKGKYLLSATFRADASSKFAEGNRWGYFPSAALAWRISGENWMDGAKDWLDDLKLRASIGTAGNNNIPTGQLVQEYENKSTTWVNGIDNYWAPSKTMSNENLKWETTITRNVGLDFSMMGGALSGTIEAYLNTTKDLLIQFPTEGTGYDNQYRNMGKTENKGIEVSLTYHIINKKNYGLDFGANIGFNKTKIKSLGEMEDFGMNTNWASTEIGKDYRIAVGGAVGEIIGYQNDGRYEVSDFTGYDQATNTWKLKDGVADAAAVIGEVRPGSMKIKDLDGNGTIGDGDITKIGDVNPTCFGGFNITARVYGFDLSANFNYSIGNEVYNANKIEYTSTSKYQYRNMIDMMAEGRRWTNLDPETGLLTNDPQRLAALNANTSMWSPYMARFVLTDWAVEKASFLKLNTVSLGYTLPTDLTKKIGINSLRFYVTAYNVFTLTSYEGSDPEADCIRKNNLTPGVDYSGYPRSRQFVVGLNLNF